MNITISSIILISAISTALSLTLLVISKKNNKDKEKSTPYECGFDPLHQPRIPFSLRFFLIAILFLIFDVEISLILPFPLSLTSKDLTWIPLSMFLMILMLGLLYEWTLGSLEWAT